MEKDNLFLYIFNTKNNFNNIYVVFCDNELLQNTEGLIKSNLDQNYDLINVIYNIESQEEQNKILSICNYIDSKEFIKINNIYFTEQGLNKKQEFLEIINENLNKNIEITIFDRKVIELFIKNNIIDITEISDITFKTGISNPLFDSHQLGNEVSFDNNSHNDSSNSLNFITDSFNEDIKSAKNEDKIKIKIIENPSINMFYDAEYINGYQNGAGKQLEHGVLLVSLFLTDDELKYLLENENTNLHFRIPNTNKTQHYFIQVLDNNNQEICQYNSNNTKEADNQLLRYTIQGNSSCFYFSLFFLKEAINYVINKEQEFNKNKFIEEFKKPTANLRIVENIVKFFTTTNNLIFIKNNKQDLSKNELEDYFIFESKESNELVFVNKNTDNLTINKFGINEISTEEIINNYNILNFCNNTLLIERNQREELKTKLESIQKQLQNYITLNNNSSDPTKSTSKSHDDEKQNLELLEKLDKAANSLCFNQSDNINKINNLNQN